MSHNNSPKDEENFVFMGHTRALLDEVWNHWQKNLGHTPEVARRMMDAAMKEFHRSELYPEEKKLVRKAKRVVKTAKRKVKTVKKKIKTVKKTVKKVSAKRKPSKR